MRISEPADGAPMIDEKELWAFAMALLRGDPVEGEEFTPERMAALEAAGRAEGVNVWKEVAERMLGFVHEGREPPE